MGLAERLKVLFRRPMDGARYVSFEGEVLNANTLTSPVTGFQSALTLWIAQTERTMSTGNRESEPRLVVEELGRVVRVDGPLLVSNEGMQVEILAERATFQIPKDGGQMLSGDVPQELHPLLAASTVSAVFVREWSLRRGDRLSLRGYLSDANRSSGGYRDGVAARARFRDDLAPVKIADVL